MNDAKCRTAILIRFRHGLGDAVQLTSVLRHLEHYRPEWDVDVAALVGKHSAFHGLARNVYALEHDAVPVSGYEQVYNLAWSECATCYADTPSTKAERCLVEVFRLKPLVELCRYTIRRGPRAVELARGYFERICQTSAGGNGRYPVVLIHYQGNTSAEHKNLPHDLVGRLCADVAAAGLIPVILDWDGRSPLPDGRRIHNPHVDLELWGGSGTGDAEVLAAMIELSSLMVGVDSGPLHVAGATSTPTLGVWTRHHPLHYFGLADNVVHLVPKEHEWLLRGDRGVGAACFARHYRFETYSDLEQALRGAVRERLGDASGALVYTRGFWIRSDNAAQDLVIVKDIAEDDSYRVSELPMPAPVVVDVGAHIGCFSRRVHERNPLARIVAVECCPENIPALQKNVGPFARVEQAAITYERDMALLNAVFPDCETTGGSTLVGRAELERRVAAGELASACGGGRPATDGLAVEATDGPAVRPAEGRWPQYWADFRPITTLTLEELLARHGLQRIDVLKLDCEGSEFSILEHTTLLDRIGVIVGEYHGKARFEELVRRRFAGWDFEILRDGELGTFRLTRRREARDEVGARRHVELIDRAELERRFARIVHASDRAQLQTWLPYYARLFELARELDAKRVCEIGVRAGYSAFAILSACPGARMLGIDADVDERRGNSHGGRRGLYRHALRILAAFDFELLIADSHALERLPRFDLIYVDGDHTFAGCLRDLELAARSTGRVLVDDYDSLPSVRAACDAFLREHPEFKPRYIDNGLTGFLLLSRRQSESAAQAEDIAGGAGADGERSGSTPGVAKASEISENSSCRDQCTSVPIAARRGEEFSAMQMTACECEGPGWCERHACEKSRLLFELCRRRADYFRLWEEGRGPGQDASARPVPGSRASCLHLGETIREQSCPSCSGQVRLKIFGCAVHGECTTAKPLAGVACCQTCADYAAKAA